MKVTLKMTLDGLVQALRWRQIDFLENPAKELQAIERTSNSVVEAERLRDRGDENVR
jgi:hypothetical protein